MKVKLSGGRITPPRDGDAGYDLFAPCDIVIPSHGSMVVDTGVALQIPQGYFGRVFARSGLSTKKNIEVGAGVVDSSYTGTIKVHLYNHGDGTHLLTNDKAIAQIVLIPYHTEPLDFVDSLDSTERGANGFGSTDAS